MSLYILRHEERFDIPKFFTPLTYYGKQNSIKLINKIHELNIDKIYCSPFLRCIQTIQPYCQKYNKSINIEYSLYEGIHSDNFRVYDFDHSHTELYEKWPSFKKIINDDYQSHLSLKDLKYPENTFKNVYNRIIPFIEKIKNNKENILLVSHMTPIIVVREYIHHKQILNKEYIFPMGHIDQLI